MKKDDTELKGYDHSHHAGRDDLAGEYRWGDAGQLALLILFLLIWVVDSFWLRLTTFLAQYVPLYIRLFTAAVIFFIAARTARKGLQVVFSEKRETPYVIRTGVFSRVRHPIYLAALFLYIGFILATFSLACLVLWVGILIFYNYIAVYEEKLLQQQFGQEYTDYCQDVPRWIPRWRTKVAE